MVFFCGGEMEDYNSLQLRKKFDASTPTLGKSYTP